MQTEKDFDQMEEKGVQTTSSSSSALTCLESLSNDLSKLLNDESQPDVELTCGDQVVAAHRNVLVARSKVFDAALSNFVDGRTGRIHVQDVDSGIFRQFACYLHTGSLPDLTVETARRFYEAGDKYAVRGLMRRCCLFLKENLAPDNACEMLSFADEHYDQDLKEHVMAYIFRERIHLQDEHWLDFCKGHPMLAIEVLNRFFKWQKATLNRF